LLFWKPDLSRWRWWKTTSEPLRNLSEMGITTQLPR
jgi:hypothetical protein